MTPRPLPPKYQIGLRMFRQRAGDGLGRLPALAEGRAWNARQAAYEKAQPLWGAFGLSIACEVDMINNAQKIGRRLSQVAPQ